MVMPDSLERRFAPSWSAVRRILGPLLLVLASLAVVLVHVPQHTQVSPIDEYVYIDYVAKVPTQLFVHQGEETGSYARNYLSCHGVVLYGDIARDFCNKPVGPVGAYPYAGLTSTDIYTPLYFASTWLLAQPLLFFGVPDLVDAARYTGFFWLAGGALLLFFTLRRLKVGDLLAAAIGLAIIGSAPVVWSNTYVSTDSPTIFVGALLGYLLVRLQGRQVLSWGLIAAASVGTLLKIQNFAAVTVVIFCLVAAAGSAAWAGRAGTPLMKSFIRDKRLLTAALMAAVPLVLEVAWLAFRAVQSVGSGADQRAGQQVSRNVLIGEIFKFFGTAADNAVPLGVENYSATVTSHILGWLMIAGVLGTIAVGSRHLVTHSISLGTLILALTLGPALVVATWVLVGIYVPLPERYGLSLMPLMLIPAGTLFGQKKTVAVGVSLCCAVAFGAGFFL